MTTSYVDNVGVVDVDVAQFSVHFGGAGVIGMSPPRAVVANRHTSSSGSNRFILVTS